MLELENSAPVISHTGAIWEQRKNIERIISLENDRSVGKIDSKRHLHCIYTVLILSETTLTRSEADLKVNKAFLLTS